MLLMSHFTDTHTFAYAGVFSVSFTQSSGSKNRVPSNTCPAGLSLWPCRPDDCFHSATDMVHTALCNATNLGKKIFK